MRRSSLLALLAVAALARAADQPDVIVVLTDDMRASDVQFMPNVQALLRDGGTTCTRYLDNVAICCPSRSTILRGQYSHDTGIADNSHYPYFQSADEPSTIATWMQAAGYRTALFGKYLNGWTGGTDHRSVPPGWTEFCAGSAGDIYGQYNYTTTSLRDGVVTVTAYGSAPADYAGTVYGDHALDFVRRSTAAHTPYFMYLALFSPHQPATPAPADVDLFPGAQAPRTANFNEADTSDKPAWLRGIPLLSTSDIATIDALYRKRLQSLQAVDRLVRDLVAAVAAGGRSDQTYILFASDNGFHLGNHRMLFGKWTAYQEDTHVPLLVRGPGVLAGAKVDRLIGNVDIAPTVLDLAGVPAPALVDGRSFAPLLRGAAPPWRSAYLIEHASSTVSPRIFDPVGYSGLHTGDSVYVEYVTGERELYDLVADPFELTNIAADPAQALRIALLSGRLAQLRGAQGDALRAAEQRSLFPYGGAPWPVPGTIEAENFDEGGEGIAYHDDDAINQGGGYRATGVDIRACRDVGGGWQVGWFGVGEWLAYTVDVAAAGAYDIAARVACGGAGATLHVECDGVDVTGPLHVAYTGGWDAWRDVAKPAAQLPAGVHALRVVVDAGAADLNDLVLSWAGDVAGLAARYCAGSAYQTPARTRIDAQLDFAWGAGSPDPAVPADGFSARWMGELRPRFSETYTLATTSDDGVRVWLDGRLIIDHWSDHAAAIDQATVALTADRAYALRVDMYEDAGSATAQLRWSSASQPLEIVPTTRLTPNLLYDGGFEADPLPGEPIVGWTSWSGADGSGAGADAVTTSAAHDGARCLMQSKATAYEVSTSRTAHALAPGIYALSAWVRSSGGQGVCALEASGYGGATLAAAIPAAATWRRIVIPDIRVTTGVCTVALHSRAAGGQWVQLDDVRLLPAGAVPPPPPTAIAGDGAALAPIWSYDDAGRSWDVRPDDER